MEPCIIWGRDLPIRMGNFDGEGVANYKAQGYSAVSCAKTAEPIESGMWTQVGPRKHALNGVTLAQPGEYD